MHKRVLEDELAKGTSEEEAREIAKQAVISEFTYDIPEMLAELSGATGRRTIPSPSSHPNRMHSKSYWDRV